MSVPRQDLVRTQKEGDLLQAKEGDLKEISPATAMILDVQPMELQNIIFCCLSQLAAFCHGVCACTCFSSVGLCDAMDYTAPGSSVHGSLQARVLECVAISFSKNTFLKIYTQTFTFTSISIVSISFVLLSCFHLVDRQTDREMDVYFILF